MTTFISMLRGINVSGQKKIRMADLETLFSRLGFKNVLTYIQSGNVIFRTENEMPVSEIASLIENEIRVEFGFEVPVILRTTAEIKATIDAIPFQKEPGSKMEKLYVTFLDDIPQQDRVEKINHFDFLPDKFFFFGKEIYLNCAAGYGTTKLSNTFFENKLKVRATTRNWNTVNKLFELAKDL